MAPHSSTLAWQIPWREEPGRLQHSINSVDMWVQFPIHLILPFFPWCPYISSLHLCLCFCFVNKIICTLFSFRFNMHALIYGILFLTYFGLYAISRSIHVSATGTVFSFFWLSSIPLWRRKWQPTPVFLPGESQGWRSLVGCHPWGHIESDTTEVT